MKSYLNIICLCVAFSAISNVSLAAKDLHVIGDAYFTISDGQHFLGDGPHCSAAMTYRIYAHGLTAVQDPFTELSIPELGYWIPQIAGNPGEDSALVGAALAEVHLGRFGLYKSYKPNSFRGKVMIFNDESPAPTGRVVNRLSFGARATERPKELPPWEFDAYGYGNYHPPGGSWWTSVEDVQDIHIQLDGMLSPPLVPGTTCASGSPGDMSPAFTPQVRSEGCKSCDLDAAGDVGADLGSIDIKLSMGGVSRYEYEEPVLILSHPELTVELLQKEYVVFEGQVTKVTYETGGIEVFQFQSSRSIVEVSEETDLLRFKFYHRESIQSPVNPDGSYPLGGLLPHTVVTLENITPSASTPTLRLKKLIGSEVKQWTYSRLMPSSELALSYAEGSGPPTLKWTKKLGVVEDQNAKTVTETRSTLDSGGSLIRKTQTTSQVFDTIERVVREEVYSSETAFELTEWDYYVDPLTDPAVYGKLKSERRSNGGWHYYTYDGFGRLYQHFSSYLDDADLPTNSVPPEQTCKVVEHAYIAPIIGATPAPSMFMASERIRGVEVSRRFRVAHVDGFDEVECLTPGAAWNDPTNLVASFRYTNDELGNPRIAEEVSPTGHKTLHTYKMLDDADMETTDVNLARLWIHQTDEGSADTISGLITQGTRTETATNKLGVAIHTKQWDVGSSLLVRHQRAVDWDDAGRVLISEDVLSGRTSQSVYDCCGLESTTDERGLTTTYTRTSTEETQTTAGVTTKTVTSGLTTIQLRQGTDGSWHELGRQTVNLAGETISSHSRGTGLIQESHTYDAANQRQVHTRTFEDGGASMETRYPDGTLDRVTGTATRPMLHEVGVQAGVDVDGVIQNVRWEKVSTLDETGALTGEWTRTWTDFAGRVWKVDTANGGVNRKHYNAVGQIVKEVDADNVTTLYGYDNQGRLSVTALDMNRNGNIDYNGIDRITRSTRSVTTRAGTTVQRTVTEVWATDNINTASVLTTQDQSVDGLQSWLVQDGLTTQQYEQAVGGTWAGNWTSTTLYPDNSTLVQTYTQGRLTSTVRRDANSVLVESLTIQPDEHGRVSTQTDGRSAVTTYIYETQPNPVSGGHPITADLVYQMESPPQIAGGTIPVTTYLYDAMGRRTTTTDALNGTTVQTYTKRGEVETITGTRQYPLSYTYTAQGRIETMTTDKGVTTWNYFPSSGLLENKMYGAQTAYSMTYTSAGRLKTKTNGRGTVITYGHNNAGDVASVDYSDTTLDLICHYDRLGQQKSCAQFTGILWRTPQDHHGRLISESWEGGVFGEGISVTRERDALKRDAGFILRNDGSTVSASSMTYDDASRLKTVSISGSYNKAALSPAGAYSVEYGYHPQMNRVSTITYKNNTTAFAEASQSYDLARRVTDLSYLGTGAPSPAAQSTYRHDDLGRRTQMTREDASSWHWGYNDRSEVESAVRKFPDATPVPLESYGYTFDDIGNPLTRTQGTRTKVLTPNALNQINTRTQPPFLPITGSASTAANVIVNSTATQRKQGYFWAELPVNNSASALYQKVTVTSSLPGGGSGGTDLITQKIGTLYVPPANQTQVHDDDGNLTQDSRWDYAWDAENRLISMTELVNSAAASVNNPPRQRLVFTNAPDGRRLAKQVFHWLNNAWTLQYTVRFGWDGWHLVYTAQQSVVGGFMAYNHYLWGLDVSGSRGGAGGVGGLLYAISNGRYNLSGGTFIPLPDQNFIPAQDANGNVTSLLAIEANHSLRLDASFHYDAFGLESANTLRSQDVNGREFPFRFSSKYHDAETGLAYYGYRYYNPEQGRFLSRDPIEEDGGINLYGMVGNDLVNRIDLLGLQPSVTVRTEVKNQGTGKQHYVVYVQVNEKIHWENCSKKYPDKVPSLAQQKQMIARAQTTWTFNSTKTAEVGVSQKFLFWGGKPIMKPQVEYRITTNITATYAAAGDVYQRGYDVINVEDIGDVLSASTTLNFGMKLIPTTMYLRSSYLTPNVFEHEFGHVLGAHDFYVQNKGKDPGRFSVPYDDSWINNIMSTVGPEATKRDWRNIEDIMDANGKTGPVPFTYNKDGVGIRTEPDWPGWGQTPKPRSFTAFP